MKNTIFPEHPVRKQMLILERQTWFTAVRRGQNESVCSHKTYRLIYQYFHPKKSVH